MPRIVIVRSQHRIYGPFASSDDALAWAENARRNLNNGALPLSVESLDDPAAQYWVEKGTK